MGSCALFSSTCLCPPPVHGTYWALGVGLLNPPNSAPAHPRDLHSHQERLQGCRLFYMPFSTRTLNRMPFVILFHFEANQVTSVDALGKMPFLGLCLSQTEHCLLSGVFPDIIHPILLGAPPTKPCLQWVLRVESVSVAAFPEPARGE